MTYTINFTFEKGKRRNQKLGIIDSHDKDCLLVIDNMGKHSPYASFCLISDDNGKHVVENIIYENRNLKSHRGL